MPTTIGDMTEDLLIDIFSRLPVKSIKRCSSVSKPWRSLVTDTRFVKYHLNRSSKLTNPKIMLSTFPFEFVMTSGLDYRWNIPNMKNPNLMLLAFPTSQTLANFDDNTPYQSQTLNLSLPQAIGSCNGLVCFSDPSTGSISLLNPSTREHIELAPVLSPVYAQPEFNIVMGLGFDTGNEDYKIVRIVVKKERFNRYECVQVLVYTLSTNSWKVIDDSPSPPCSLVTNGVGALVNGILHWQGQPQTKYIGNALYLALPVIVSFDLTNEKFGVVQWPDVEYNMDRRDSISEWEGCLTTIYEYGGGHVDIWTMKEYGVRESWARLFSLTLPFHGIRSLQPVFLHNVGDTLVEVGDGSLLLYDWVNNRWRVLDINGAPQKFQVVTYVEALTSIASLM